MTILETIQTNPVFLNIPENYIQSILSSRSVDGAATYDESSLKDVELVTADLYYDMTLLPEFKEGQLSVKYSLSALKQRAKVIYDRYDDPKALELGPRVIEVSISAVDDL